MLRSASRSGPRTSSSSASPPSRPGTGRPSTTVPATSTSRTRPCGKPSTSSPPAPWPMVIGTSSVPSSTTCSKPTPSWSWPTIRHTSNARGGLAPFGATSRPGHVRPSSTWRAWASSPPTAPSAITAGRSGRSSRSPWPWKPSNPAADGSPGSRMLAGVILLRCEWWPFGGKKARPRQCERCHCCAGGVHIVLAETAIQEIITGATAQDIITDAA